MIDIDAELTEYAREWTAHQPPITVASFAPWRRERGRRRWSTALAIVAAATAVTLIAVTQRSEAPSPRVHVTGPNPTPLAPIVRVVWSIDLGQEEQYPASVAVTPGSVSVLALPAGRDRGWVTTFSTQPSAVPAAQVRLDDDGPIQIVGDSHALWVSSQQGERAAHVVRVQHGATTATLTTAGDANLALYRGALWVLDGKGVLLRVDPNTAAITSRLPLPGGGYAPKFVSAGPLGVWLSSPYDGSVWRLSHDGRSVTSVAAVRGGYAGTIAQLHGQIWVQTTNGLAAIGATTGRIERTVDTGRRILAMASDGTSLWLATDDGRLERVTTATGRIRVISTRVTPNRGLILALAADVAHRTLWVLTSGTASAALCHAVPAGSGLHSNCPQLVELSH